MFYKNNTYKPRCIGMKILEDRGYENILTLDQVKNFLHIKSDIDDNRLHETMTSAVSYASNFLECSISERVYEAVYTNINSTYINLAFGPIINVLEVKILKNNIEYILPEHLYFFSNKTSLLYIKNTFVHDSIIITYRCALEKSNIYYQELQSKLLLHVKILYQDLANNCDQKKDQLKNVNSQIAMLYSNMIDLLI